MNEGK